MGFTNDLFLTSFAPLLQIWGGICVLFFYADLLTKSPLKDKWVKSLKGLGECLSSLLTPKFQELLPEGFNPQALIDEINNNMESRSTGPLWQTIRTAVYNLAKFGFFHVIILLIYVGFEYYSPYKEMYHALLTVDFVAILYILVNYCFYKTKFVQSEGGLYVFVSMMGMCLFFYPILFNRCARFYIWVSSLSVSRTAVTSSTLLINIFAYLLVLLAYYIRGVYTIGKCNRTIKSINHDYDKWTAIPFIDRIPWRIRWKLLFPKNDGEYLRRTGREQIEEYLKGEFKALLTKVNGIMG